VDNLGKKFLILLNEEFHTLKPYLINNHTHSKK